MLLSSHTISTLMTITMNAVPLRVKITSQAVTAWWPFKYYYTNPCGNQKLVQFLKRYLTTSITEIMQCP
jgi:hypothetical protein